MKRIFLPILLGVLMISAVLPSAVVLLAMMFLADRENRR